MNDVLVHPSPANLRLRLFALVGEILEKSDVHRALPPDTALSELGVSSLKMVSLMMAVEVEFNVTIPQEDITPQNFHSVASIEALLARLLKA